LNVQYFLSEFFCYLGRGGGKKIENFNISKKKKISVENRQGSSRVYIIKSQYTHHLSLLQMMSTPTPKRKKRFWVLAFGVCEKNKTPTQYTHTSCEKKECLFTQHSFDG
jgi:hypothetical protein